MSKMKSIFSKKNLKKQASNQEEMKNDVDKIDYHFLEESQSNDIVEDIKAGKENRNKKYKVSIEESCESLLDSMKQLEELKLEYHAVTSYLTDIQKIDSIEEEEKEELVEVARKIVTATREKASIQTSGKRVSELHYKTFQTFEDDIEGELSRMKGNEVYLSKIEKDMKHLEGEKQSLFLQKDDVKDRMIYIKKLIKLTSVFVIILFALFGVVGILLGANVTIPFLLTILMGVVIGSYVMIQSKENKKESKLIEAKLNRAISLLNKVKIKYINTKNALDYSYQKYSVKTYTELMYLWEQYKKAIEDEKKYSKHSEVLETEKKELVRILKTAALDDPAIWMYQAVALIDNKEMVEVRHSLNVRRQKLRDAMDYNNKIKEDTTDEVRAYLNKLPEEKAKYEPMLRKFGIYI